MTAGRIRPMTPADLDEVSEIEERSFANPWSRNTFRNLLRRENAVLLVAESATGAVEGYAAMWFVGWEAELGDLAVRPKARRSGVGSQLLLAVLAEAEERGARSIHLDVRVGNAAARRLYEEAGLWELGVRSGYYSDPPEDALVMGCSLPRFEREAVEVDEAGAPRV